MMTDPLAVHARDSTPPPKVTAHLQRARAADLGRPSNSAAAPARRRELEHDRVATRTSSIAEPTSTTYPTLLRPTPSERARTIALRHERPSDPAPHPRCAPAASTGFGGARE